MSMKKGLFVAVILVFCLIVVTRCGNKQTAAKMNFSEYQWPDSEIAKLIPVPESNTGNISWERSDGFAIYVNKTSKQQYDKYVNLCKEKGFVVDYSKGDDHYYANDESGYKLSLMHQDDDVMYVCVNASSNTDESETQVTSRDNTNFENTCWGDDIATVKKYETDISWTSEDDTTIKGMTKFLNKDAVVEFDFENGKLYQVGILPDIDYADKKDLYMEDFNNIKDSLKKEYGEPGIDNPDKYWTKTDNKQAEYGLIWTHDNMYIGVGSMSWDNEQWLCVTYAGTAYIDSLKTKEQTVSTPTGISPEFKAAMDSYEAFFDEYVAFMKKYKDSTNQASMMTDYANYMKKYAELMGKMNDLNSDQLSTDEAAYYVEVSARITQKLAAAAQ